MWPTILLVLFIIAMSLDKIEALYNRIKARIERKGDA
jgi:hypothetical protein